MEIWYKLLIHFDVSYKKFSSLSLTVVDCPQPTWHADLYITNVLKQWSDSWSVFLPRWYSRTLVPFVWHFKQIKDFSGIWYDTHINFIKMPLNYATNDTVRLCIYTLFTTKAPCVINYNMYHTCILRRYTNEISGEIDSWFSNDIQ